MNCDEAKRLMMDIDHLGEDQQAYLENHAQSCPTCAGELSALRSMMRLTRAVKSVDVSPDEDAGLAGGVMKAIQKERAASGNVWMSSFTLGRATPWLAAASLFLAGLFVYEQFPSAQLPEPNPSLKGTVLNASVYRKELNKIRDTDAYRARLLCRSPYRKPEQTAECIRQKFLKTSSL
jgi:hypothetical protein